MSDDYLPGTILCLSQSHTSSLTRSIGVMVLGHSLRDSGTTKQLAALVTLDSLQASTIDELKVRFDCGHQGRLLSMPAESIRPHYSSRSYSEQVTSQPLPYESPGPCVYLHQDSTLAADTVCTGGLCRCRYRRRTSARRVIHIQEQVRCSTGYWLAGLLQQWSTRLDTEHGGLLRFVGVSSARYQFRRC